MKQMRLSLTCEGCGKEAHLTEHRDETVGACRGEVLGETYLLDEVEI